MPRIAPTLYEFVGADDGEYLKVMEAVLRIYNRQDELRANRARARIKVLIDRIGMDAFRELVEEELRGDWVAERDFDPAPLLFLHDEEAGAPAPRAAVREPQRRRARVRALRRRQHAPPSARPGFVTVEVRIPRGDLDAGAVPRPRRRSCARHSGGYARTTVQQNLVLRWVREESIYEVWRELRELGLDGVGPRTIADVVSCPGTDSCKLGITSSMGLNAALAERVESLAIDDPLTRQIHIKVSRLPERLRPAPHRQHRLHRRLDQGRRAHRAGLHPADRRQLRGRRRRARTAAARRACPPSACRTRSSAGSRHYRRERLDGEPFTAFVARTGTEPFEELVADLSLPPEFSLETMGQFIDWSRSEPFQVIRGEGECAV